MICSNVKPDRNVSLLHFPWSYLLTIAHVLLFKNDNNIEDEDQGVKTDVLEIYSERSREPNSEIQGKNEEQTTLVYSGRKNAESTKLHILFGDTTNYLLTQYFFVLVPGRTFRSFIPAASKTIIVVSPVTITIEIVEKACISPKFSQQLKFNISTAGSKIGG